MRRGYSAILFIIILISISFFYHYNEIAFKRPQSVHKWRQSDCASITLNYYQGGMKFFNSETHNLTSDGGTTGKCCTSEIPILYYAVASFYKVFGYHEYVYRIFNTLIFFLGLFFLFQFIQFLLKDNFWAIALTILFFTSPVLVYYGNNFLSNSTSLAFSIIGWYYFIRFSFDRKPKWFYISIIVFFIAAALKVTALFSIFAILGIYLLELLRLKKFNTGRILFNQPVKYFLSIIFVLFIIGLWAVYAHNYNQKHDCSYFSTTIFPLWNLDRTEIKAILDNINKLWLAQYFHKSVLLFLSVCFLFIMVFFRKNNALLMFSLIFIFAEIVVYIILQFWTFADHDYYTINMYILPILIVVSTFDILKRHFNKIFNSAIFKVVFSLFLLFNIYYAHQKITERYEGWMNDYQKNNDLYTITPYLRQIGISSGDTVISIPDKSNVSLYLMNQKGWTEYTDAKFNRRTHILYNQDSIGIKTSIEKGAKYLIANGISELYEKAYLQSYCSSLKGNYGNVLIFDLGNTERNFNLKKRTIDTIIKCNAELLSADKQFFVSEIDTILLQFGSTQSDKYAHSGKFSSKLDASSPYGMTIKFDKLKNGESFKILVWRKADDKLKGGLIASSSPNLYYNNEYKILQTDSNGWDHICMEFFITSELTNQELVIYVYNPDPDPVYFDDLEIIRYKSVFSSIKL
jgi:hypothetical protein